jgi:hypothetical protein
MKNLFILSFAFILINTSTHVAFAQTAPSDSTQYPEVTSSPSDSPDPGVTTAPTPTQSSTQNTTSKNSNPQPDNNTQNKAITDNSTPSQSDSSSRSDSSSNTTNDQTGSDNSVPKPVITSVPSQKISVLGISTDLGFGDATPKDFYSSEKLSPLVTRILLSFSTILTLYGVVLINNELINSRLRAIFPQFFDDEPALQNFG